MPAQPVPADYSFRDCDRTVLLSKATASTPAPETLPFSLGDELGSFRITSALGEGAMGVVFQAHDLALDRTVALKFLWPHLRQDAGYVTRFRSEACTQARMNHPNIAHVHGLMEWQDALAIQMEYVEGETLAQRLAREQRLDVAAAIEIVCQALTALEHAHGQGVVHRDLKPGHLVLTPGGKVKLVDFGVARAADSATVTRPGAIVGSPRYLAPEQVLGQHGDARTDLYAIGLVLFEALTGQSPFRAHSEFEWLRAQVHEPPRSLRDLAPDTPPGLEAVVGKLLAKSAGDRYDSAAETRSALAPYAGRRSVDPAATDSQAPEATDRKWRDHMPIWLRGWRLDSLLATTAVALFLSLGLLPHPPLPGTNKPDHAEMRAQRPTMNADVGAPPTRSTPWRTPKAVTAPSPSAPPPKGDQYLALRRAWGG